MRSDIFNSISLLKGEMEKLNEKIDANYNINGNQSYEYDQYCVDYDHLENTMEYLANIQED